MYVIETRTAPNPRRVRIFLAEKGISVDFRELDMMQGALKTAHFSSLNPMQRVPVLVLDSGEVIAESVAICRYFEGTHPEPPLFGQGSLECAQVEMWQRRVELGLFCHIAQVFRHLNPKMAHLEVPQVADWGHANRPKVLEDLVFLDQRLAMSRFIAGADFTIADITAMVAIDFLKPARIERPSGLANLERWYQDVAARPSAVA